MRTSEVGIESSALIGFQGCWSATGKIVSIRSGETCPINTVDATSGSMVWLLSPETARHIACLSPVQNGILKVPGHSRVAKAAASYFRMG